MNQKERHAIQRAALFIWVLIRFYLATSGSIINTR